MASWDALREHLVRVLGWEDTHASFDAAVANLPEGLRGEQPAGLPYSPWTLVEPDLSGSCCSRLITQPITWGS